MFNKKKRSYSKKTFLSSCDDKPNKPALDTYIPVNLQ